MSNTENQRYRVELQDDVSDFEDVLFLVRQLEHIKPVHLEYADGRLKFFCKYQDVARTISQIISDCGFKCCYFINEKIESSMVTELDIRHVSVGKDGLEIGGMIDKKSSN